LQRHRLFAYRTASCGELSILSQLQLEVM
jgi:hypothetical protein